MQKALLLAEKDSMMHAIEQAYKKYKHKKYDITFVSAEGHLLELYKPGEYEEQWEKWSMHSLPIVPNEFKIRPTKKGYERYDNIRKLIKSGNFDVIINGCDAGREGELIATEIFEHAGNTIPELRLWCEDLTEEGIWKAFDNLRMPQTNLKKAAKLRAIDDWLIGVNTSRAISLSVGETVNMGRVIAALLTMIVQRDYEKESFKPKTYYQCDFIIKSAGRAFKGTLLREKNKTSFESENDIKELMISAVLDGTVSNVKRTQKIKSAPLLHDLAELQKEAYSEFSMSPQEVLDIAQSLYMKKYISYPRTDCQYISSNVAAELTDNLYAVSNIPSFRPYVDKIMQDRAVIDKICKSENKWVADAKLTDHHAIIPTKANPDFGKMTDEEIKVYILIARRLLAIFLPDKITERTEVICTFGGISTLSKGFKIIEKGYSEILPSRTSENILPDLVENEIVELDEAELIEKESTSPSYYNYKTLLEDMQTAGGRVKDKDLAKVLEKTKGIGSASTRAASIKKLEDIGYIEIVGNGDRKHIESTVVGRNIYELIKETDLASVVLTAKMEQDLDKVVKGEYGYHEFYKDVTAHIFKMTSELKELKQIPGAVYSIKKVEEKKPVVYCPKCKRELKKSARYYYCPGKSDGSCNFVRPTIFFGATVTEEDMIKLIQGEKITKRCSWNNKKSSNAVILLGEDWLELEFPKRNR